MSVNKNPAVSIGITLWVSGAIVSGELIGLRTYQVELANSMRQAGASALGDALETGLEGMASASESAEDENVKIGFLHLRDARAWSLAEPVPSLQHPGVPWRGRLSKIDAWTFGIIGRPRP